MSCTLSDLDLNTCKFSKKIHVNLKKELKSQETQLIFSLSPKMTKFNLVKELTKINPTITSTHHAHLKILTETSAKLQKDLADTKCLDAFSPKMTTSELLRKCQKLI